ncbi:MAG: hypothetical protein KF716_08265 [Anaerolineae bacterium]|nr:hypothetical protein [Anaerolineae bacterium]
MSPESPADRLRQQYEQLRWGTQVLALQPAPLQAEIAQAAATIVLALLAPAYQFTLELPTEIITESSQVVRLTKPITIRAGGLLHRIQRKTCEQELLKKLTALNEDRDPAIAQIANLVNYSATATILTGRIPAASVITAMRAYDHKKQRLCKTDEEAEAIINRLTGYVEQLRIAEQLYPGWMASDLYTEKRSALLQQVTEQGAALAHAQTLDIIENLKQLWQRQSIGGGLTLFVPYMDEDSYHMRGYRVEVMPNARIPFRPDFVVSACRLAEQQVRQNRLFAQRTRWQLLTLLDLISQAFELRVTSDATSDVPDDSANRAAVATTEHANPEDAPIETDG